MSAYGRVNWQNAPSTATPLSAANLNTMDAGIANCPTIDGATPFTAAMESDQALSGSAKVFARFKATDDKTYVIGIDSATHRLYIYSETDSKYMAAFTLAGSSTLDGATVQTKSNGGSGSGFNADSIRGKAVTVASSAPGSPNVGDIWVDTSTIVG